jgi:hypothetical protein
VKHGAVISRAVFNSKFYLDDGYVLSLRAFFALRYGELHFLSFRKRFEAGVVDGAEVYEDVWAVFLLNKTKTFGFIKPFNVASAGVRHSGKSYNY